MTRIGLAVSVVVLVTCYALSAYAWGVLPGDARIPVHFGADGSVNRYGGKLEALLFVPGLLTLLTLLFAVLPSLMPRKKGLEQSRSAYLIGWIGGMVIGGLAHGVIVAGALGVTVQQSWVLAPTALMVMALGNVITKSRSNWLVGIRTPWSLSSEDAWVASNRVAGWGLVLSGIATLAALFLAGIGWALPVFVGCLLASVIVGAAVSYFVWRNDPEAAR